LRLYFGHDSSVCTRALDTDVCCDLTEISVCNTPRQSKTRSMKSDVVQEKVKNENKKSITKQIEKKCNESIQYNMSGIRSSPRIEEVVYDVQKNPGRACRLFTQRTSVETRRARAATLAPSSDERVEKAEPASS
jgi:hypothetical protein